MFSVLTMVSNLIADVLYAVLDPRIRLDKGV
jgi:ABC-type dipeptide/oligopeptide/nickel transport system permease component